MIREIRKKILQIINHDLDRILEEHYQPLNETPNFRNFKKNLIKKLKRHDEFMASINKRP